LVIYIFISAFSYANAVNTGLANNLFRLHVIANSNSDEDQNLKYIVRDNLISYMYSICANCTNKKEAMSALASKTDNSIILKINSVLEKSSAELKEVVESELKKEVESLKQAVANAQNKLSNSSKFIYEALGEAPETKIFTTDVTRNTYSAEFLIGFGCEDFSELTKTKKSDESLLRELEALL
jgi:hypothetical protein